MQCFPSFQAPKTRFSNSMRNQGKGGKSPSTGATRLANEKGVAGSTCMSHSVVLRFAKAVQDNPKRRNMLAKAAEEVC